MPQDARRMHVAVTGATGFIGRRLVERLLEQGHQVTAFVRKPAAVRVPKGVLVSEFDAVEPLPMHAFDHVQAVVHLAGEPISVRWTDAQKERIRRSRVHGTRTVADAVRQSGVPVFISGSAVGIYGARGEEKLDESAPPGTDFLGRVCQAWEAAAESTDDTRVVHVRMGLVLGPSGGALQAMLRPFQRHLGGPLGSGRQWMSWIHREDAVSLLLLALRRTDLAGPLNATAPNPVTNSEFTQALARVLGKPQWMRVPAFALKLALGEMAEMLLTGQRVIPQRALAAGFQFAFPTLDQALVNLLRSGDA